MTRRPAKSITKREIAAIHSFYAPAYGRTAPEIPKARAPRVVKPRTEPSEADILKAIMQLLRKHPMVAKVWRQNSGTAQYQYGSKTSYVRFNTARGMSDIMGILKTGRTLAIEVKTKTGAVMPHQHEFLEAITKAGGVAFVARDVETVVNVLNDLGR